MPEIGQPLYLCLDQGGHASRAVIVGSDGGIRADAFVAIETHRDGDRVEHNAEELLASLRKAAQQVVEEIGGVDSQRIVAAGLATQRSSIVCWDKQSGASLSPVISWQDTRAAQWLKAYEQNWDEVHSISGLALSPHYGASKLRWCLDNLTAVQDAAGDDRLQFGPLATFLAAGLTGFVKFQADPANASRTLLWDRHSRDWSDRLLELFDIPREYLPASVASKANWGRIKLQDFDIPLSVVTGDQSAAVFAFGNPEPDCAYINIGTGAFVQMAMPDNQFDSGRLLASVVFQGSDRAAAVLEGTVNGAGSAVTAVADQLGISMQDVHNSSEQWLQNSQTLPLFVNCISGLGSPWWRTDVSAHFSGDGNAAQKISAVLESIVFLLTINIEQFAVLGHKPERLVVTGGLGSLDSLLQRLADLTAIEVVRSDIREGTVVGLAYLLADLPQEWPAMEVQQRFMPTLAMGLNERFDRWKEIMPAL